MVYVFCVVILVLCQTHCLYFLNITLNQSSTCAISSEKFWLILRKHFTLVSFMTITILHNEENISEVNQITEEFLSLLFGNYYHTNLYQTVKIQEKFARTNNKTGAWYENVALDQKLDPPIDQNWQRVKLRTSDSFEGFIIIVWDPQTLDQFLNQNFSLVVPRARATYFLLFVFSIYENCKLVNHILKRFWSEFSVLNIIAQTPYCCNKVYIHRPFVKTTNSWGVTQSYTLTEVTQNLALITNPLLDLNQFPLRIALFEKNPTAIRKLPKALQNNPIYRNLSRSKGFAGSDGFLLSAMVEYLNFDPLIDETLEPMNFGHVLPNGTVCGVLAEVVHKRTDYAGNCRLMTYFGTDGYEFTAPYSSEKIAMVVPKAGKVPRWRSLFNCFNALSWSLIFSIAIVSTVFWCFLRRSQHLKRASWEMFAHFVGIPCRVVPSRGQFMFLTACMMFNIIILGIIQGSFFTDFTTTSYYPDLNTLEQVLDSNLPIMAFAWRLLRTNSSPILQKLEQRSIPYEDNVYELVALYRNVAALDRRLDLELEIKTKYSGRDGVSPLHIVDESLVTFLTTSLVPKGSPFLVVFNHVIRSMFEAGLTAKWYDDVVTSLIIEHKHKTPSFGVKYRPFTLQDVQAAFYVIAFGYSCSVFVFWCEIIVKFSGKIKHFHYYFVLI